MTKTTSSSLQILPDAIRQQLLIGAATIAVAGGLILHSGETAISMLYVVCFAGAAGLFAYSFPITTIGLWALLALYGRQLMGPLSLAGGVDARASDPILLGIMVALALAFVMGDKRILQTLYGPCLIWSVLMAWIGFQFLRSIPDYGMVRAVGEFRSTFQAILVLPYIVIFIRSKEQQIRLFKVLLLLSIVFIVVALLNGALTHGFAISRSTRWMTAQVNLALVMSMGGWLVARRTGLWANATVSYSALLFATLVLVIVCNHRSVWMVSAGLVLCLAFLRLISVGKLASLIAGLVVAGLALDLLARDVNLIEFLRSRMTVFISYQEDSTAHWRAQVWAVAIEQAKAHPFLGKGFGNYFFFELPDGRIVTSILHNLYVQIALQIGLVGLLLYVAFVAGTLKTLWKSCRAATDVQTYTLSVYAIAALAGGSLFYIAYGFDPFTWLFVGLGLAVTLTQSVLRPPVRARSDASPIRSDGLGLA